MNLFVRASTKSHLSWSPMFINQTAAWRILVCNFVLFALAIVDVSV